MQVRTLTPLKSLNAAYRREKIARQNIDRLKEALPLFLNRTRGKVSESTLRDHFQTLLRDVSFPAKEFLVQSELRRMDTVIHDGPKRKDDIGVIVEAKTSENRGEMFSAARPNVKSLQELVLYFLREREAGNTAIKNLIITDGDALFVFADKEFERLFWDKKRFRRKILTADADRGKNNDLVYAAIGNHVDALTAEELHCTALHLETYRAYCEDGRPETDEKLLPLYKVLSPVHLLRRPFAGDSNHLDKRFYRELLHIIGLEEVGVDSKGKVKKNGGKKIIRRRPEGARNPASLLENTLQIATKEDRFRHVAGWRDYGADDPERRFAVCLELCLTWVNRILFLKLLETQLAGYHDGDRSYHFLTPDRIPDYDALNTLFFDVLNKPMAEREAIVSDFGRVPYLNSSLFEISPLEDQVIRVNSLKDQFTLPLAPGSVLGSRERAREMLPLEYLFTFLNAYDFGGEGRAGIQEDNKRLINASVLGLIFEKINGYRDGSFYTPGFITEYMCRQTIRRAVVRKFSEDTTTFARFRSDDYDELKNFLAGVNYKKEERLAANALINGITVCDPAVGSGHFLVSALNELIATKSDLGILGADAGARAIPVTATVENDELLLNWHRGGEPFAYRVDTAGNGRIQVDPDIQTVQETLFREKRTLIENCLFGVDLNPNSVKICRLRLWIELLKHAHYNLGTNNGPATLETLPNIDINIKQGNSLISRFALDDELTGAFADSDVNLQDYRRAVSDYHRARGRDSKEKLLAIIEGIKNNFTSHISRNDKRRKSLATARGKMEEARINIAAAARFGIDDASVNMERKMVAKQEKIVQKLTAEIAEVENNAIYDNAFEWRFEFPAVLGEDGAFLGFDVVVGNPPYVRIQDISRVELRYYTNRYVSAGRGNYDLYVPFVELSTWIIGSNGIANFIIPHKFCAAKYGQALRAYLVNQKYVSRILHFGASQVFNDATTYTGLFWFDKDANRDIVNYASFEDLSEDMSRVSYEPMPLNMLGEDSWVFISGRSSQVYQRLQGFPTQLDQVCSRIFQGIKTSYDKIYIFNMSKELEEGYEVRSSQTEKSYFFKKRWVKKLIRGGDSRAYQIKWSKKVIVFPYEDGQLSPLSEIQRDDVALYDYLKENEADLRGRENSKMNHKDWYGYVYPKALTLMNKPKVFTPDIAPRSRYGYDEFGSYYFTGGTSGGYGLLATKIDYKLLLGFLNSSMHNWYISKVSTQMRGGWYSFESKYISKFPIPVLESKTIEYYAMEILSKKSVDPTADTTALETQIDHLVYKLYDLTYEEVLIVDPDFALSAADYEKLEA